jgi:hypothetical protein
MSAGGLEVPIAKAAASAVTRIASSPIKRAIIGRKLERASQLLDVSEVDSPTLTPAQAATVSNYIASRDFHIVAVQFAFSVFEMASDRKPTIPDDVLTAQLREGLRNRGDWDVGILRQLVGYLKERLTHDIATSIRQAGIEKDTALPANMLAEVIASIGDQAAAAIRNSSLLQRLDNLSTIHEFEIDLRDQIKSLMQNMRVPNASSLRFVPYEVLYVEPRLQFAPTAEEISGNELLDVSSRTVILGDPGGGKSTLAAKTVYDLASDPGKPIPLLLVLRDHTNDFRSRRSTIVDHLAALCRSPYQVEPPPDAIEYILLNGRAFVIFDGLDEIFETNVRTRVVEAIQAFAHRYPNVPILISSRKVGYESTPLDSELFPVAKLLEFSDNQVKEYVQKWFALDQSTLADKFVEESGLVADLRSNPLMLSLMCGLYCTEGYIPANRPDVYEKCALLLFERWDKQRGVIVPLPFDAHIREAIQSLAWWLYTEPANQTGLTRAKLQGFMTEFLRRERFRNLADAENAANSFIDFCTGRAWVLSKIGSAGGEELYGFTHRTFLEYFAATQMSRKYPNASQLFDQLKEHLKRAEYEVVGQLAVQALNRSIENGANDFLEILISAAAESELDERSNLLAFASRSLGFVVPNPMILSRVVSSIVAFFLEMPDVNGSPQIRYRVKPIALNTYDEPFVALRQCVKELIEDIGLLIVEYISTALDHEPVADNVLLICEDPEFFLEKFIDFPAIKPKLSELSIKYFSHLGKRRFVKYDIGRVRDGTLAVSELIDAHGVDALYLSVAVASPARSLRYQLSLYAHITGSIGPVSKNIETVASEISHYLPSREPPWVYDEEILSNTLSLSPYSPGAMFKSSYFAAIVLLTLPTIEYITDPNASRPTYDVYPTVDEWYTMCVRARLGKIPESRLRTALMEENLPPGVTDLVLRWSRQGFDLLADAN